MTAKNQLHIKSLHPIKDNVFVTELDSGVRQTIGGIIIPDDDMANRGIRDRWGKVYAIGPDVKDIEVGEWLLIKHGRWTPGIELVVHDKPVKVWKIEWPDAVMLAATHDPRSAKTMSFA